MDREKLWQGIEFLSQQGLNLCAVLDCAALPGDVVQLLRDEEIPLERYARLVLLGNGGQRLWQALAAFLHSTARIDKGMVQN